MTIAVAWEVKQQNKQANSLSYCQVLFRFAIAFLKKSENEILQQRDGLQLNKYLRIIGEKMTNVKQISWVSVPTIINPLHSDGFSHT